ncbi:hypothetical protein [Calycomorphotria hydatis]|uniref:Fructose-bisphosphate aldolase n=1 Tax=Calycomorphotria hydatis TaxID=2528027 RepID=A0A517T957_9PLAN|nr:hypothetical protein [Calycomorphotria hydatis]QDT64897.1 hypothetical protein V22_21400 [Calycomorphotria hydatis]
MKSLDFKLERIQKDSSCGDFIIADAKDADMAMGLAAPGTKRDGSGWRSLSEYRELIRQNVSQGLVDIMLMSASTSELLSVEEQIFEQSTVTPAVRLNDTTDIWFVSGGTYHQHPARPFRTATLSHAKYGKLVDDGQKLPAKVDLGLYSITFNNGIDADYAMVSAYKEFRIEAEKAGMRHFLEVFNPNCPVSEIDDIPRFVNDSIARTLAGVPKSGRPQFLKIAYNGPEALEALLNYDDSLIIGILGGSSGTTYDAFHQLWEAKKYGARIALYGRMINNSEDQLAFIQHLRWLADGEITDPADAVRSYHAVLSENKTAPIRSLEDDLQLSSRLSSYSR